MNNGLKPCPFCGGEARVIIAYPRKYFRITYEHNCCLQGKIYKTKAESVKAWNIRNAPTIDAEPVRHGSWTPIEEGANGHLMECSLCKSWIFHNFDYASMYCPDCGAKMDGEGKRE